MRPFNPQDKLVRAREILSTELDQETVLLSIDAGAYYGMGGTAQSIWEKLAEPIAFSALVDALVQEYEIEREACAADLQGFLAEMEREGLLRVE
jgi:hypothetical protein